MGCQGPRTPRGTDVRQKIEVIAGVGLMVLVIVGCYRKTPVPVTIGACVANHPTPPGLSPVLITLENRSDRLVTRLRVSVDASDRNIAIEIPPRATRSYLIRDAMPLGKNPNCKVWSVVFAYGKQWEAPSEGPWFP
jgi:hypothetical protein